MAEYLVDKLEGNQMQPHRVGRPVVGAHQALQGGDVGGVALVAPEHRRPRRQLVAEAFHLNMYQTQDCPLKAMQGTHLLHQRHEVLPLRPGPSHRQVAQVFHLRLHAETACKTTVLCSTAMMA